MASPTKKFPIPVTLSNLKPARSALFKISFGFRRKIFFVFKR